ncbi:MAG: AAA family ATPase [Pseudomonadota bacterium]|nr:AAA family ATPase [Pseudomonadota bacterium]MDE3037055.1 AAA family ATPase [Pseudomonadota bacterium]
MSNPGQSAAKPPFLAFVGEGADIATLKSFAGSRQWPDDCIHHGNIGTASQYLKSNPSPALLLIEIPSAEEAPPLLDQLANVCDPDTKVITVGRVNEYSFYCWLMDLGIFSYLLMPLSEAALESAYQKSIAPPSSQAKQEKPPGGAIAVIGARGGVGASTVALSLAGIIADLSKKQVALVDVDPQEGSIALALDIEPSRGLREALEKPDRIDSLFIERVMTKPLKNLSVLSAEEALQDRINVHDNAADTLMKELRGKFDVTVLDIPRRMNPFARAFLKQADQVVLVAELTLPSLRDALRLSDMMCETLKMKPPVIVASRVGCAPKQEMQPGDFEKGVNAKIMHRVPFAPDLFMPVGSDIPALKYRDHAGMKPLYALASQLVPGAKQKTVAAAGKGMALFAKFKKRT